MQTLNRYVGGRQEVGHIDLLDTISYFEVPEKDARKVMTQLSGIRYHGRTVRCNSEEEAPKKERSSRQHSDKKGGDWRQFFPDSKPKDVKFKGEEPDFSEEGWARRRPKRKK